MNHVIFEGDLSDEAYTNVSCGNYVALDIETTGLDRFKDTIELVQLYNPEFDTVYMVRKLHNPDKVLDIIADNRVKKLIHYAMFDMVFFQRDYATRPHNIRCTRIAAQMFDKRREILINAHTDKVSFSLANLTEYFFNVKLDKSIAVSNWRNDLSDAQIQYAMNDVLYLPSIYVILMKLMDEKARRLYNDVCEGLPLQGELLLAGYGDVYKR